MLSQTRSTFPLKFHLQSISTVHPAPLLSPPSDHHFTPMTSQTSTPSRFKRTAAGRRRSKRTMPAVLSESNGDEEFDDQSLSVGPVSRRLGLGVGLGLPQLGEILPQDFFEIDSLELAPRLLGKYLKRDDVVLMITEVEAYRPNDSACHGRFGITSRTAPVFGPGGHAYVYLCYGLHMMLNIVADKDGIGSAVLIRSCCPINGLETIQERRGQKTDKPILLSGPGKVGQALGISTDWSHHPLFTPGGLEVLDGPEPASILIGPRVGIDYASLEHVKAPWRFAIADTPWISAPKNTLRPQ